MAKIGAVVIGGLAVIWGGFGYMVFCDQMAICGIFFPLVSTGQVLSILEDA